MRSRELLFIPNVLSLTRLVLTAPLSYLIWLNSPAGNRVLVALVVVVIATDILDGYLARRLNQESELGRIIDPLADKIVIAVVVAAMVWWRGFPVLLFVGLMCRDLLILVLGAIVSKRQGRIVEANAWGKANTVAFAVTGLAFLAGVRSAGFDGLAAACYLTLAVSGIVYYTRTEPHLNANTLTKYSLRGLVGVLFAGLVALAVQRLVSLVSFVS